MQASSIRTLFAAFALAAPVVLLAQAAPADPSAQLREALRSTTLQLRNSQGELSVAQAERDQARADLEALQKRLDAAEKQAAADRTAAQTNLANLNSQLLRKDAESARLADALKNAKDAHDRIALLAARREDERAALAQSGTEAEREIADLRRRNRNLFHLGSDILTRYENFGLGRALGAREPFTKLTRVKLQNEVQEYTDALEENRAKLQKTERQNDGATESKAAATENQQRNPATS